MILWPAIDILGGKAVRLVRGRFGTQTEYDEDPADAARRWVDEGARALHVVDLAGAKAGAPVHIDHLERIATAVEVPIRYGGGLRTAASVEAAISAGADQVVLGTVAYRDPDLLDRVLGEHPGRVVVSIDVRNGVVAGAGWTEETEIQAEVAVERLGDRGVRRFVYSSIDRDGMLAGPDLDGARRIGAALKGTFVYSGGVASLEDLQQLAALAPANLTGVIVGKALYEGRFTAGDGQSLLDRRPRTDRGRTHIA